VGGGGKASGKAGGGGRVLAHSTNHAIYSANNVTQIYFSVWKAEQKLFPTTCMSMKLSMAKLHFQKHFDVLYSKHAACWYKQGAGGGEGNLNY
jgi:hypothetical protein